MTENKRSFSLPLDSVLVWKNRNGRRQILIIDRDENPWDPREEGEPIDHMVCWHRNYRLGDDHNYAEPRDFLMDLCDQLGIRYRENAPIATLLRKLRPKAELIPLWLYDHSGITIRAASANPFMDNWDSGQVGWIYMTRDEVPATDPSSRRWRRRADEFMQDSVEIYDMYLRGDVYGYTLYSEETAEDGETVMRKDSCWGFYGDDLYANGIFDAVGEDVEEAVSNNIYLLFNKADIPELIG